MKMKDVVLGEEKRCPMLAVNGIMRICEGEDCAWWALRVGACSIRVLADKAAIERKG